MIPTPLAGTGHGRHRLGPAASLLLLAALALVSLAAVIAPAANAGPDRTMKMSFHLDELNLWDRALSEACGFEVVALVEGEIEKKLERGKGPGGVAARETQTFDGTITWIARASGNTYTDKIENRSKIEYPQGVDDFWLPAHVTVTGSHGGTFPFGGGMPGNGKFEYDAIIYSADPEGFPYITPVSDPIYEGRGFERATAKICAALS
jgi:hypothetical protein